ncbi:MAG: ABC transporter substrate-binding protein [Gammaproteobacteria bacterium]
MKTSTLQLLQAGAVCGLLCLGAARAATPPDTLVIARDIGTLLSLDPQEAFEIASGNTLNNLYLRLVMHDPRDYQKIVPGVAQRWQASSDGKQVVFDIRPGLKFQSGAPVTAEDAAFSLHRGILMGKPSSIILRQFGWTRDNVEQLVRAEGDKLVVSFEQPYPVDLVLSALSTAIASVVDRKEVLAHQRNGDLGNGWLKTHSAGAGPYRLREWKSKDAVVLEAFPGYVGGAPKLERVIIRHVAEPSAQRLLLEKGDVDVASDLNPDQIRSLEANADVSITRIPRGTVYYLALNQANPALAKPEVWEAARWLVDYEGLADKLFLGQYKVNQAPVAQGVPSALEDQPYKLDVGKAKALLARAGYPDGFSVAIDTMPIAPYREIAQSLQGTFAQAGVKLDLRVADSAQVLTRYRERRHDLIVFVWAPDYSDPSSTIEFFTRNLSNADDSPNKNAAWRSRWLIPELTEKTEQAAHELDADKRMQDYAALQREVRQESPFVFMLQQVSAIAHRRNVLNYGGNVTFDSTPFQLIEKR